jgi:hypothetical protein
MCVDELKLYIKNILPILELTTKYLNANRQLVSKIVELLGNYTFFDKYEYGWCIFERIRIKVNMYKDNTMQNIKMEIIHTSDENTKNTNEKIVTEKQLL